MSTKTNTSIRISRRLAADPATAAGQHEQGWGSCLNRLEASLA